MKKQPTTILTVLLVFSFGFAQSQNYWRPGGQLQNGKQVLQKTNQPGTFQLFELDLSAFKNELEKTQLRGESMNLSNLIMVFPTSDGTLEKFSVVEAPTLHPDLASKYPGIKSYAGQGINDPTATIRFSLSSQLGLHGMISSGTKRTNYIDPYTSDRETYIVYSRNDIDWTKGFECFTDQNVDRPLTSGDHLQKTNDKKLRKYRLALSCTAEYGNIFAGSGTDAQKIANILAQMNVTMTRVNGVYEKDLAITLEIIPNNDLIIYFGDTSADPWTGEYNTKTQQVIDADIGDANYDIGHNFNTSGGGNAGCIGCVCVSGSKGSGYTGRADPTGDPFDIDYVAHEMGHQFGGYHTMNTCSRSGSGSTEVEPASASTIMGYAGICATNIQNNSDDYFAYVNIRDISLNIQTGNSSSCAEVINLSNEPPTADAGPDYTIPISTAFVLRGQGSDPDGDALTYTWEQNDPERAPGNGSPQSTWTVGPLFRSIKGTTSPDRYMPAISDVVAGDLSPTWEVVPSVARNMEFSLTVRDNHAGGGQTSDDLMNITVHGSSGPFLVSAPNTATTWNVGQAQTVTWDVAGTDAAPVSCANVNIMLSTDGGFTYPVVLAANTPNDGSQAITVPNNISATCRIKVEAADNIFYDISDSDFAIEVGIPCTATIPTGLIVTNIGSSTTTLDWDAVPGASYGVRYRATGTTTWSTTNAVTNTIELAGLAPETEYEAQVRSECTDANSEYGASVTFTTSAVPLDYCTSNGNSVVDEYIGRVELGSIDNSSGAGSGGYTDNTGFSTDLTIGVSNTITITPTWTGIIYNEGYSVWIDYNQDGDFTDSGEQVWSKSASKTTPVSGSFTVPSGTMEGNTRMRVSMKYNGIPTSCESFNYGEVEDYTVNIISTVADTEDPTAPTGLTSSNITTTSVDLSWTASTDNVGVTGYDISVDGSLNGTSSTTSYAITGLTPGTTYSISVVAKDAAGNQSTAGVISVTTDTPPVCTDVTLTILLDNYPEETSWTIKDSSGATVASGGTYGSSPDGSTVTEINCLDPGCYDLTINDSYGDGICCGYGNGSYILEDASGNTLASGASFGFSETTNFCIGGTTKVARLNRQIVNTKNLLYPNPVREDLHINMPNNDIKNMKIFTVKGVQVTNVKLYKNRIDVSELISGIYFVAIETEKEIITRRFIKE